MINSNKTQIDKNLFLPQAKNTIAVVSGQSGLGKTWFAITLAHALNILKQRVLLFDADNGLLNTDFQLALPPTNYLNQVATDEITLYQAAMAANKKKLHIIRGTAGSGILEDMPIGRLQVLADDLSSIAHNFDITVIDMPLSEKISSNLLSNNTDLILLCTGEPHNLVSTYDFLQNKANNFPHKSLQIVINYANSYEEGLRTYNTLRSACEQYSIFSPELLGVIRNDTRVRDTIRNHTPLLNRYPNAEASEDIMKIAEKILLKENMDE